MKNKHYALIWDNGACSVGEDFKIAEAYCRKKRIHFGLLRLNGGNRLVYSLKLNGQWRPQGTITDTGSYEGNRRTAFRDFFRYLLNNQDEFSIIRLPVNG